MLVKLIYQARKLHETGQLEAAKQAYLDILQQDNNNVEVLHALGVLYAQQTQYPLAIDTLQKAIGINNQLPQLHNSLANIYLRQQAFTKAIDNYQKAIKLDNNYASAYNNLGNCYAKQDDKVQAISAYKKAILLDPSFADPHFNLATLYAHQNEMAAAIKELKRTLNLTPQHAPAMGQLAQLYLKQNEFERAQTWFEKRLALQPTHAISHANLGLIYLKKNEFKSALKHLKKAADLAPNIPDVYFNLATAFLKNSQADHALSCYMRQANLAPSLDCYYNIAVLLMDQDRHKEAIEYFKQALKLEGKHLPSLINLGAVYLKAQQLNEAIGVYEALSRLQPDNLEYQHILAALKQQSIPKTSPSVYVENLFDHYALNYEKHLTEVLQYNVPRDIYIAVADFINAKDPHWHLLDLGCGTGFIGALFKDDCDELIGVDLSENMLALAKQKHCYTDLIHGDIVEQTLKRANLDIIIAADVFSYLGDLGAILNACYQALKPDGVLAFSVEKTTKKDYILQRSVRYAHNKNYIEQLAKANKFEIVQCSNLVLRQQHKKPVDGYLLLLQKPL